DFASARRSAGALTGAPRGSGGATGSGRDPVLPGHAGLAAAGRAHKREHAPPRVPARTGQLGWPLVPLARQPRLSGACPARALDARVLPAVSARAPGSGVSAVLGHGPLDAVVDNRRRRG